MPAIQSTMSTPAAGSPLSSASVFPIAMASGTQGYAWTYIFTSCMGVRICECQVSRKEVTASDSSWRLDRSCSLACVALVKPTALLRSSCAVGMAAVSREMTSRRADISRPIRCSSVARDCRAATCCALVSRISVRTWRQWLASGGPCRVRGSVYRPAATALMALGVFTYMFTTSWRLAAAMTSSRLWASVPSCSSPRTSSSCPTSRTMSL
mmetsp:Transcript_17546/g.52691  ORF Transcript_17546/g.52691 Transcript_17546/m.52691 type:complete len:211 (-) Transcript_17546:2213-2845(-)